VTRPELSGVVVHWHNQAELARLTASWPVDPRYELLVVDNGSAGPLELGPARLLGGGVNRGFAAGVNLGVGAAAADRLLILNPDLEVLPGALDELVAGFEALPQAAGLVPTLLGRDGTPQTPWQARTLPSAAVSVVVMATVLLGSLKVKTPIWLPFASVPTGRPLSKSSTLVFSRPMSSM
jgi:GT2 family glycosyltransferase